MHTQEAPKARMDRSERRLEADAAAEIVSTSAARDPAEKDDEIDVV